MGEQSSERREFLRVHFNQPIEYQRVPKDLNGVQASSVNVSPSGIMFQTPQNPPDISSIVLMNLDYRTISICKEIEKRALILNNQIVGRVVRVEESPENSTAFDVGVCFLTQDQTSSKEVQDVISK